MPVPSGTKRWCATDQQSVELTPAGDCPICGASFINFIEDTGSPQFPHTPPAVEGDQITEED